MATSPTGIVNDALLLLGESTIADLSDQSDVARACNGLWADVRDEVLASHPWNGCTKQAVSTRSALTPIFSDEFSYAYIYPHDCLRILRPSDDAFAWDTMVLNDQKMVYSNDEALALEYIFRQTNVSAYSGPLALTLAKRMAMELCLTLTGHIAKRKEMEQAYQMQLAIAKAQDGQEQSPDVVLSTTLTSDVRMG